MQAFYRLTNPDGPDGLSVIQALVMKGDLSTTETILRFSPSSLDISIALLTAGTADFLISRMLAYVNLSPVACSPDKLPIEENSSSEAVLHILNKTVKKFQNISLLREVVSKGSLSQLQKVLAGCKKFKEDRKSCLEKTDQRGRTLLMSACASGKSEVVEFLLANGARVDARDNKQRTALHFSVANNSLDVVMLLVRSGARIYDEDDGGLMSLHYASQNGRNKIVFFLIEHGCDVNHPTGDTYEDTERSLTGSTALHFAAQNGHNETILLLLRKGAKVDSVNLNGQTPLMLAAKRGHVTTVELLLHRGADINASDVYQNTVLEIAVLAKTLCVAKLLIQRGINTDGFVRSMSCERLLTDAISGGDRDLLQTLINVQDSVKEKLQEIRVSPWDKTLLHVAAETKGNFQVIDLLTEIFPEVNVKNPRGKTPLHCAADVNIARKLLETGAKVNET